MAGLLILQMWGGILPNADFVKMMLMLGWIRVLIMIVASIYHEYVSERRLREKDLID